MAVLTAVLEGVDQPVQESLRGDRDQLCQQRGVSTIGAPAGLSRTSRIPPPPGWLASVNPFSYD